MIEFRPKKERETVFFFGREVLFSISLNNRIWGDSVDNNAQTLFHNWEGGTGRVNQTKCCTVTLHYKLIYTLNMFSVLILLFSRCFASIDPSLRPWILFLAMRGNGEIVQKNNWQPSILEEGHKTALQGWWKQIKDEIRLVGSRRRSVARYIEEELVA